MATSNSWDTLRTGTQILTAALEDLGEIEPGGTVSSALSTMCLNRLNNIFKQYSGRADGSPGLKIHTRQRVTLLLQEAQQSYLIGPASTDARASTQMGRTTIRTTEAAGQTVLDITATTDTTTYPGTTITMTASDIIAVEQNDGTLFFSTISSTGAGPVVTIGAGLDVAAAAGNYVYWFTSRAQRLVHVESVLLRDENYTDTALQVYSDAREYDQGVSDKYADGDPSAVLIEPLRIATRVTLNSQPSDVTKQLIIVGWYPTEDIDSGSDDVGFPQEAFRFLVSELAFSIAPGLGAPWTQVHEKARVEARASYLSLNPEMCSIHFHSAT